MVAISAAPGQGTNLSKKVPQRPNTKFGRCLRCKTTNSTKWRTGPDGTRTLCRACFKLYHGGKLTLYQSERGISIVQTPNSVPVFAVRFRPISPRQRHLYPVVGPNPAPQDQLHAYTYKGVPPSACRSQRPDQKVSQDRSVDGPVAPSGQRSFPAPLCAPETGFGSGERVLDDHAIQRGALNSSTAPVEADCVRVVRTSSSGGCDIPVNIVVRDECATNDIINAQSHGTEAHVSGMVSRYSPSTLQTRFISGVSAVLSSTPEYNTGIIPGAENREGDDVQVFDDVVGPSLLRSPQTRGLGQGVYPMLQKSARECGDGSLSSGAEATRETILSKAPQLQSASTPPPVGLVPDTTQALHNAVLPNSYRTLSNARMAIKGESEVGEAVNEGTQAPAITREETGIANSFVLQMQKITNSSRSRSEVPPGPSTNTWQKTARIRTERIEKCRTQGQGSGVHIKAMNKEGDTRRFTISPGLPFLEFKEHLMRLFELGPSLRVSYKDEEGDLVAVSSHNEMKELFRVAEEFSLSPIRIYVAA